MQGKYFIAWKQNFSHKNLSFEIPVIWPQTPFPCIVYYLFLSLCPLLQLNSGIFPCYVHAYVSPTRITSYSISLECPFCYPFFKPHLSFKYLFLSMFNLLCEVLLIFPSICDFYILWTLRQSSPFIQFFWFLSTSAHGICSWAQLLAVTQYFRYFLI